jgi:septal ring factor EnvC (AmiA/AmiB activator)
MDRLETLRQHLKAQSQAIFFQQKEIARTKNQLKDLSGCLREMKKVLVALEKEIDKESRCAGASRAARH